MRQYLLLLPFVFLCISLSVVVPPPTTVYMYTTKTGPQKYLNPENKEHHLAVLIPFRDRFKNLKLFIPYMHKFLRRKKIKHTFVVINQMDTFRFNRAALINTGFLQSEEICDYFVMHDVDLLPQNEDLDYSYPEHGPFHVAAPHLHPMYHYEQYIGGILLLNSQHFRKVNGMSNDYWGWGREDDEFYRRLQRANLTISRPTNIDSGNRHTFRHLHDEKTKPRDTTNLQDQDKEHGKANNRQQHSSGLDTLRCSILSKKRAKINEIPVTVINVKLHCNVTSTPWCIAES